MFGPPRDMGQHNDIHKWVYPMAEKLARAWNDELLDCELVQKLKAIIKYVYTHMMREVRVNRVELDTDMCDDAPGSVFLMIPLSDRTPLSSSGERMSLSALEPFVDGSVGMELVKDANYEVVDGSLYLSLSLRKPTGDGVVEKDARIVFEDYRSRGEGLCKQQISRLGEIPACDRQLVSELLRFLAGMAEYQVHMQIISGTDSYTICARGAVRIGIEAWHAMRKKYLFTLKSAEVSRCYIEQPQSDTLMAASSSDRGDLRAVGLVLTIHLGSVAPKSVRQRDRERPSGSKAARSTPYGLKVSRPQHGAGEEEVAMPASAGRMDTEGRFYATSPTDRVYITPTTTTMH